MKPLSEVAPLLCHSNQDPSSVLRKYNLRKEKNLNHDLCKKFTMSTEFNRKHSHIAKLVRPLSLKSFANKNLVKS